MRPAWTALPNVLGTAGTGDDADAGSGAELRSGLRAVPEEAAIGFHLDGRRHAVMMATPADLEDFAVGFCLNEGLVTSAAQVASVDWTIDGDAVEVRVTRRAAAAVQPVAWTRDAPAAPRLTAPSGCGLCGVACTARALRAASGDGEARPPPDPARLVDAIAQLQAAQVLNRQCGALHAAGFWHPDRGLLAVREDIGRHCALDKLAGALARAGESAAGGAVLLTSRVSLELVQKAVRMGASALAAVSAPTALAVRTADAAGLALAARVRGRSFELFTAGARPTPGWCPAPPATIRA